MTVGVDRPVRADRIDDQHGSRLPRYLKGLATAALIIGATLLIYARTPAPRSTVQAVEGSCSGSSCGSAGEFHALDPLLLLDTTESGRPEDRKTTHREGDDSGLFSLHVAAGSQIPEFVDDGSGRDANIIAVVLAITIQDPTRDGYLRLFGDGRPEPETPAVFFEAGVSTTTTAIVVPGDGANVTFRLVSPIGIGSADIITHATGWFSTDNYGIRGARVTPTDPIAVFGSGLEGSVLGPSEAVEVAVGAPTVSNPDGGSRTPPVTAVLLSLTASNLGTGSHGAVSIGGRGDDTEVVALTAGPGRTATSLVVASVGSGGRVELVNDQAQLSLTVHVVGYMTVGHEIDSQRGRLFPLSSPFRVFDTRGEEFGNVRLPPGNAENWTFDDFVSDFRVGEEPAGPLLGLLGTVTGAELLPSFPGEQVESFLTIYPADQELKPDVANLSIRGDEVVSAFVLVEFGPSDGGDFGATAFNQAGFLHYALDVSAVILA